MRHLVPIVFLLVGCTNPASTPAPAPSPKSDIDVGPAPSPPKAKPDGQALYSRVCVTCHGKLGNGDGLGQPLFSFGSPASEWNYGPNQPGILKALRQGTHESSMKGFNEFSEPELKAIAEHVLELRRALTQPQE